MNSHPFLKVAPLLFGVGLLASCASLDGVAESVNVDTPDEAVEDSPPTVPEEPDSTESSAAQSSEPNTADESEPELEPNPDAESDPDSAPPTTETGGLDSNSEESIAPEDLTCWRVEDFGEEAAERWRVINDGVMGGLSEGNVVFSGGTVTFSGTINTNGGGFSMIRTNVFRFDEALDGALDGAEYLRIRARSANGRGYELTLQDSTTNTAVMHFVDIPVSSESAWEEPIVSLANLRASAFGNPGTNLPAFNLEEISTIGIILADGLDGPFSIEIDRIDACSS